MTSPEDVQSYVREHGLDTLFDAVPRTTGVSPTHNVDPTVTEHYAPEWDDLVRLHRLIRERKATTVLEFGCGFSTIIMADGLRANEAEIGDVVRSELRRGNPFEIHAVDDMEEYLSATRDRVPAELARRVSFHLTEVAMTTFQGRIATEYRRLPNICPDFIYLDGPSQHSVIGDVNGISTAHPDRLPMACDLLRMEHFLLPGTLILVDGRTANARFLRANFQREWRYEHDREGDVHLFEMVEEPLGPYNRRQIEVCLGAGWP